MFFQERTFLFAVFEEQQRNDLYENNVFLGFKRISFDDEFLYNEVKRTWDRVRELIIDDKLELVRRYKADGTPRRNADGSYQEAPNFPKSSEYVVFLRGSGQNAADKTLVINGLSMYKQQFWLKGKYIVDLLEKTEYIE